LTLAWPKERRDLFDDAFLKKLEYLYLVSKKIFSGRIRGERRTRKSGSGIEFADHRDYAMGDDFRYIDWNIYGRMDKLLLRLFEEEEDLSIYLLFDASTSMRIGEPAKLDYVRRLCAALCYVGLANLDRVAIVPFSDELHERLPPARGKGRIFKAFDFLKKVEAHGETRIGPCVSKFVHQNRRRGMAVLLSDFYDPAGYEEGINVLRYHHYEPFVIQVYDPKEAHPPLHGDLTLIDCETGEQRQVTVSPSLLDAYEKQHETYCHELEHFCTARGVPFFRTHTQVPFEELVLRIFRAGGFLR
jgi:uncharacterized protein (DUF58 family)